MVLAFGTGEGQHLAVGGPEQVVGLARERGGAAHGQEAQGFGERRQRRLGSAAAAESGDRGGEGFEGIADQGRECTLAPALDDPLQAADTLGEDVFALLRRGPGQQAQAQADHGAGVGARLGEAAHGVADGAAVGMRECEEGGAHAGDRRVHAGEPAALDQHREAAGKAGVGETLHQFRERAGGARPERHVEGAVEAVADANPGAAALRLPDQELRSERRRERAVFGRLGRARRRVVGAAHRAPVRRGRIGAVEQPAHEAERGTALQPLGHEARFLEQRVERIQQRRVPRWQAVLDRERALRVACVRQPPPEPFAEPLAVALRLLGGERRRPRPNGGGAGLGGEQRREAAGALTQEVVEIEAQSRAPAALAGGRRPQQVTGLIGGAFEYHMQCMARIEEGVVEPPVGEAGETLQFLRPHRRARAVEAEQRDQRTVAAKQRIAAGRGRRRHEALQRLAPERPAQREGVLDGAAHGGSYSLGRVMMVSAPPRPKVSERPLTIAGAAIRAAPTTMAVSPEPMLVCCGWSTWRFSLRRPKPTMAAPTM